MIDTDEFKLIFFTECDELLADMEERLLKLDGNTPDKESLNAIFRCAHSIKGGSGAFGLDAIMRFTHTIETLLDKMREGEILASSDVISLLLKSVDIIHQMLEIAKTGNTPSADLGESVRIAVQNFTQGGAIPQDNFQQSQPLQMSVSVGISEENQYDIQFAPHEELFKTGNEPLLILSELAKIGKIEIACDASKVLFFEELDPELSLLSWSIRLSTDQDEGAIWEVFEFVQDISDICINKIAPLKHTENTSSKAIEDPLKQSDADVSQPKATSTIRVDLEKIDKLVNMVGELVITEAMINAQVQFMSADQHADLLRGIGELSHHTRELQEAVMAVRMQPIKSVFSRMPRIVRDTAAQLGKEIDLIVSGENTEVDKTVIEQLGDPLTHMVRNSCDHGIETPDQRVWNDKPIKGTIHLSAFQRSGRIIIEVSDDGAGINRRKVLEKSQEKGLVAMDAQLTDEEIDHLVFLPGFSTADAITNVSGRGVGMDVVKRNIESLGGVVHITSAPGKGSTFTISLPLTLAILDGMIVRVGCENYIIAITSIIETMRPKSPEVHFVLGKSDVVDVRGEFIPLVYLHEVLQIEGGEHDPSKALVVLVENGKTKFGLVVDELVGQQQVVVKSLEANADPVKGISGATILGDGKVALILEMTELWQLHHHNLEMSHKKTRGLAHEH